MEDRILIGSVPVDSGSVILADPCYFCESSMGMTMEEWYDRIYCSHDEPAGLLPAGGFARAAVSSAGIGDGIYPVYATFVDVPGWGRRVSRLEVIFLEDEPGSSEEEGGGK